MTDAQEKIVEIREFTGEQLEVDGYDQSIDGFDIVTNKQVIRLWLAGDSQCCESFGYLWTNDTTDEFVGAELRGITRVDTSLNTKRLEALIDDDFYERNFEEWIDSGDALFINIETDRGVLQFTAYNRHNGYYGHHAGVASLQLTEEKRL